MKRVRMRGDWYHPILPEGAVYVGRQTPGLARSPFANPYPARRYGVTECLRRYTEHLQGRPDLVALAQAELPDRDLACWCDLQTDCHADILINIVRGGPAHAGRVPVPGRLDQRLLIDPGALTVRVLVAVFVTHRPGHTPFCRACGHRYSRVAPACPSRTLAGQLLRRRAHEDPAAVADLRRELQPGHDSRRLLPTLDQPAGPGPQPTLFDLGGDAA